jgi:hypothetical protein
VNEFHKSENVSVALSFDVEHKLLYSDLFLATSFVIFANATADIFGERTNSAWHFNGSVSNS